MKSLLCVLSISLLLILVAALTQGHISTSTRQEKAPTTVSGFPTPSELRARACRSDPDVCRMEAGTMERQGPATVPKQMRAIYEATMEWAIEQASKDFMGAEPNSATTQKLLAQRRQDPEAFWANMIAFLEKEHPEVAAKYSGALKRHAGNHKASEAAADEYHPYWGFVPQVKGHAYLNRSLTFSSPCFSKVAVNVTKKTFAGSAVDVQVEVTATGQKDPFCEDLLYFSLGPQHSRLDIKKPGQYSFPFDVTLQLLDPAWNWDLLNKGVRVYRFDSPSIFRSLDYIATLLLFTPMVTGRVEGVFAQMNVDYLSNYTLIEPYPRHRPIGHHRVNLTPGVDLFDGDLFAKMDLNGLGSSEMIAQGVTSGHVAIAMTNQTSGQMMVCEAVTKGIICTEYNAWTESMQSQNLAINLVPLAATLRPDFNLTKAWEFMDEVLGNEYGFHNIIFSWIDTNQDNYPCFPGDWTRCLQYEHFEGLSFFLQELLPSLADTLLNQALNHRAGTQGLDFPTVMWRGWQKTGLSGGHFWSLVEEDHWRYQIHNSALPKNKTKSGRSMVCSVTACETLRAAGIFQSTNHGDFDCTEIATWDMFSMKIFDTERMNAGRPAACVAADPSNPLCQITGTWTFNLNTDVNARVPYVNISDHCASRNPFPYNRSGCFQEGSP